MRTSSRLLKIPAIALATLSFSSGCETEGSVVQKRPNSAVPSSSTMRAPSYPLMEVYRARETIRAGLERWKRDEKDAAWKIWRKARASLESKGFSVRLVPARDPPHTNTVKSPANVVQDFSFDCKPELFILVSGRIERWDPHSLTRLERIPIAGDSASQLSCDAESGTLYARKDFDYIVGWDLRKRERTLKVHLPRDAQPIGPNHQTNEVHAYSGDKFLAVELETGNVRSYPIPVECGSCIPYLVRPVGEGRDMIWGTGMFGGSILRSTMGTPSLSWLVRDVGRLADVSVSRQLGVFFSISFVEKHGELRELETGKLVGRPSARINNSMRAASFSPSDPHLAVEHNFGKVVVLEGRSLREIAHLDHLPNTRPSFVVPQFRWSHDGRILGLRDGSGQLRFWDSARWTELGRLNLRYAALETAVIDRTGLTVAGGAGFSNQIWLWSFDQDGPPFSLQGEGAKPLKFVGGNPQKLLATVESRTVLVRGRSGDTLTLATLNQSKYAHAGDRYLVATSGNVSLYDDDLQLLAPQLITYGPDVDVSALTLQARPDGLFVVAFSDGTSILGSTKKKGGIRRWKGAKRFQRIVMDDTKNNPRIVAIDHEHYLFDWNAKDQTLPIPSNKRHVVRQLDLSDDGQCILLVTGNDARLCAGQTEKAIRGSYRGGRFLATGAAALVDESSLYVFDINSYSKPGDGLMLRIDLLPDGEWFAVTPDGRMDASPGERLRMLTEVRGNGTDELLAPMAAWDDLTDGLVEDVMRAEARTSP